MEWRTRNLAVVAASFLAASASAEDMPEYVLYACDPNISFVVLSTQTAQNEAEFANHERSKRITERINFAELIQHGPEERDGEPLRTGSSTVTRTCGAYTVTIAGGFLNPNPQGEAGAEKFPVVSLRLTDEQALGPISLGRCDPGNSRYNYSSECPANWAVRVQAQQLGTVEKPLAAFELEHAYSETRFGR